MTQDQEDKMQRGPRQEKRLRRLPLVVHWLRIYLTMQGTWDQSLAQEEPLAKGQLNPCATTTEPVL